MLNKTKQLLNLNKEELESISKTHEEDKKKILENNKEELEEFKKSKSVEFKKLEDQLNQKLIKEFKNRFEIIDKNVGVEFQEIYEFLIDKLQKLEKDIFKHEQTVKDIKTFSDDLNDLSYQKKQLEIDIDELKKIKINLQKNIDETY